MPGFPRYIDLGSLGSFGFVLRGQNSGDDAGFSVASAGDINNDGYDDFIIGAQLLGASDAGAAYVVFGKGTPFSTTFLGSLTPADGFRIDGATSGDRAGSSVASAGDFNNDGYDDIIVGAELFSTDNSGAAYVIFGKASGFADISLATLSAADGFRIESGGNIGRMGRSVHSAGDINNDGFDDVIVGASDGGANNGGSAYVIFGKASGFGTVNVLTMTATDGFSIVGAASGDSAGISVSTAGDINDDGYADIIVGAPGNDTAGRNAGIAYVIYGKAAGFGTIDLSTLAPVDGFRIIPGPLGALGNGVSGAGDFNGDGIDDLVVGMPGGRGGAFLLFGKAGGYADVDLDTLPASDGFQLLNPSGSQFDEAGYSVSAAGDINGDGFADLIIGDIGNDDGGGNDSGAAYIVYGHAGGFMTLDLRQLLASEGFGVRGDATGDHAGNSVSAAGDVNNDGYDDLIVGAPDALGSHEGAAYVIYGRSTADTATLDNGATDGRFATSFTEDGAAVGVVDGNAVLSSTATISSMTIEYSDTIRSGDRLAVAGPLPAGITASGGFQSALVLSGNGTAADYQLALSQVRYANVGDNPTAVGTDFDRNFRILINTDVGTQLIGLTTIAITGVDDPAVARNDSFGVSEAASALNGNVFTDHGSGADFDPDSPAGSFSVIEVNGSAANVGNAFLLPSGAILRVFATGQFVYELNHAFDATPAPLTGAINQPAYDSFTYRITGGSMATVTIRIDGVDTDDFLVGPAGPNTLAGGNGNDTYLLDDPDDLVTEFAAGGARDVVYVPTSYVLRPGVYVEVLSAAGLAGTAPLALVGNELAQEIYGNAGDNFLQGGGGIDYLIGFGGNDTYYLSGADGQVVEGAGQGTRDIIYTPGDYTMVAGVEVEVLSAANQAGTNAQTLIGNSFNQEIYGNQGANFITGGGGTDLLIGLGGNDTYLVDGDDYVGEAAGGGRDVVYTTVSYALGVGQEIEVLSTISQGGTGAIDLTGNERSNEIYGNAGANTLNGGAGADYLAGYGGADSFAFTTALGGGNVDAILDFAAGTDKIALDDAIFSGVGTPGAFNAGAFVVGTAAADGNDRIVYNNATGQLFYDADGNGAGAAVLFATLNGNPALAASDFQVI